MEVEATRGGGSTPSIVSYPDEDVEAKSIAQRVKEIHIAGGKWSNQAILVRTNAQTEIFASALQKLEIPVKTSSGRGLLD